MGDRLGTLHVVGAQLFVFFLSCLPAYILQPRFIFLSKHNSTFQTALHNSMSILYVNFVATRMASTSADAYYLPHTSGLRIDRPFYSQDNLHEVSEYAKPKQNSTSSSSSQKHAEKTQKFIFESHDINIFLSVFKKFYQDNLSNIRPLKTAKNLFPIFTWLPTYDWKLDFPCDVIAGVTVAIMHIPQGLGYALLASVPAVVGIYMAFFPNIIYVLLGTSRHNSMGEQYNFG
jgi:Sulfate permease family